MSLATDNDSDDLYCSPSPEAEPKRPSDAPRSMANVVNNDLNHLQRSLPRIRPQNTSVAVGTRFARGNTDSTRRGASPCPPPFVMSDEWAAINEASARYAAQLRQNERESMEAEIEWREKEFKRLEEMSRKPVPVRFPRPMTLGRLKLLAEHPDLLLRIFQSEREISRAIERCEVQFRHMYPAGADPSEFYYTKERTFRRRLIVTMRLELEPIAKTLLTHIMDRLCARVGVELIGSEPDGLLCLLEDDFVEEVIAPQVSLRDTWEEGCKLEQNLLHAQIAETRRASKSKHTLADIPGGVHELHVSAETHSSKIADFYILANELINRHRAGVVTFADLQAVIGSPSVVSR